MSFPVGDMNNFVAGAEDGRTYSISRHGGQAAAAMETMEFSGICLPFLQLFSFIHSQAIALLLLVSSFTEPLETWTLDICSLLLVVIGLLSYGVLR